MSTNLCFTRSSSLNSVLLALIFSLSSSCGKKEEHKANPVVIGPALSESNSITDKPVVKTDPNTTIRAEVLPVDGPRFAKFSLYDSNERCVGIQEFSEAFVRSYGQEVALVDYACEKFLIIDEIIYSVKFSLSKKTESNVVEFYIKQKNDSTSFQLTFDGISRGVDYNIDLAEYGEKLGQMGPTLNAFLNGVNSDQKIFGRSYSDFLNAVFLDLNANGISIKGKDGVVYTVGVTLLPTNPALKDKGVVRFDAVPAALFDVISGSSDGTQISIYGLFGCSDLSCLNDGSVAYQIKDEYFSFWRVLQSSGKQTTSFRAGKYSAFPN